MVHLSEEEQLESLKTIVSADNVLGDMQLDDGFLLKFLRARDGDVKRAHQLLQGYFDLRENQPVMFKLVSAVNEKRNGQYMWQFMDPLPSGK